MPVKILVCKLALHLQIIPISGPQSEKKKKQAASIIIHKTITYTFGMLNI